MGKKRKFYLISVMLLIVINFAFFVIGYLNYLDPELGNFDVLVLKEENGRLNVEVTPSYNATEYEVSIFRADTKIYEIASSNSFIELNDFQAEFNDQLDIEVVAKNKNGDEKKSRNKFVYYYKDSTFEKEKDHYHAGTKDLTLFILGYDEIKKYTVELFYGNKLLYTTPVTSENVVIPYQTVEGYSGRITAHLKNENNRITSSFNFYLNTPIVGKLDIVNPSNYFEDRWNDVELLVSGGENANTYYANLYKDGALVNKVLVKRIKDKITIPADSFLEDTQYTLVLQAVYDDFYEIAEEATIDLKINKKEATQGVYTTHNPTFIKSGTKVGLKTVTSDATIYYTLDGSEPTVNSMIYKYPITITEDMILKTFAVSKNRYDSVIRTYSFKIMEKTPIIYLSPSNQNENYGVGSVGYTTEMEIMNKLADVVERELKANGIIVYRNNPKLGIDEWVVESKYLKADFHFALHSNASSRKTARGPEIHVDNEYSLSYSIASNIYENLWNIYDGNDNYDYYRGIKFTRGTLGEASDHYLECSSLLEVAFHDEYSDASWIINNLETIGKNIANSIVSYYN